jgi:hypothetical protein
MNALKRPLRFPLFGGFFCFLFAFFPQVAALRPKANYWPTVVPIERTYFFANASEAAVDLQLVGTDGTPLYQLSCRPGGDETNQSFDYSGDFECRLVALYWQDSYSTLLTEDPFQERDWQSRARFFAKDLVGSCASYPEYGAVRTFRLRGIKIVFRLDKILLRWQAQGELKPILQSFGFHVRVEQDPTALSAIAEPVPIAPPSVENTYNTKGTILRCEEVRLRHVPGVVTDKYITELGLSPPFPAILPTRTTVKLPANTRTFRFAESPLDPEARALYLPIRTLDGKLVYEFMCSAYVTEVEGRPVLSRWGLSCGLFAVGNRKNLLEDAIDPYTRVPQAHIFPWQLFGDCSLYPGWGARRKFRLRGLELSISFREIEFLNQETPPTLLEGGITNMVVEVEVKPDATATSALAPPPSYPDWARPSPSPTCNDPSGRASMSHL